MRFAITSERRIKLQASFGNQLGKFHKVGGKKLETTVRQVDVDYTSRTNRHCPEILRTGENRLIVHRITLFAAFTEVIVRSGGYLCKPIWK
jgi:hypothetical protein